MDKKWWYICNYVRLCIEYILYFIFIRGWSFGVLKDCINFFIYVWVIKYVIDLFDMMMIKGFLIDFVNCVK